MGNPQDLRERKAQKQGEGSSSASDSRLPRKQQTRQNESPLLSPTRVGALLLVLAIFALLKWTNTDNHGLDGQKGSRARRAPVSLPKDVLSSCTTLQQAAMSFDDGPGQRLDVFLDAFKATNITVAFHFNPAVMNSFTNGTLFVKRALAEGHLIGVRFDPNTNPMTLDNKTLAHQLASQSAALYNVVGVYPKFVRYNFGQIDPRVDQVTQRMNMLTTSYNVDA
ncbi:hypothetical protein RI367_001316 [Sorochytrium milnesiophthora]